MYKTILVPLDGSKRSEAILPHVEELARRYAARIIFLQVVEPVLMYTGRYGLVTVADEETKQLADEAAAYVAAQAAALIEKGIEAVGRSVYGRVVETIIQTAEAENVDLIALASHGRTGLPQVFYGSIAAGILHRIDRPLLLIRS
jgi:nucleotide-binding universal stress UspA family protein